MPQVRVTLFEDPIEVPDDEIPVLRHQGLLREEAPAAAPTTPASAAKATPKPSKDA